MLQEESDAFQTQRPQISPYFLFVQKNRDIIESQNPNLSNIDIALKLSVMWSNMSNEERAPYVEESSVNKFPFSFSYETFKHEKPKTIESQISETITNASSQISLFDYPLDSENYFAWLGAKVVNQFVNSHGYLPNELTNLLIKGQFIIYPFSNKKSEINQQFRKIELNIHPIQDKPNNIQNS